MALKWFEGLARFAARFRHPVSLPEEVGEALGIEFSNWQTPEAILNQLRTPAGRPTRLYRMMPRERAEAAFGHALRTERFPTHTLYSFYFDDAWLNFRLDYDGQNRLRRLYMQHRSFDDWDVEIPLARPAVQRPVAPRRVLVS